MRAAVSCRGIDPGIPRVGSVAQRGSIESQILALDSWKPWLTLVFGPQILSKDIKEQSKLRECRNL